MFCFAGLAVGTKGQRLFDSPSNLLRMARDPGGNRAINAPSQWNSGADSSNLSTINQQRIERHNSAA
jgi:hypothetical protein